MVATPDKGYLVYAEQKKAPDLTEANPDYQSIKAQLMQLTAGLNSGLYLGELVDRELAKAGPVPDGE
jgi:peptidyl-prolyl cis-trans isomerase D